MDTALLGGGIVALIIWLLALILAVLWLIFPIIVMSRLGLLRNELKEANKAGLLLIREVARGNSLLEKLAAQSARLPPLSPGRIRIAKNGEDLGTMELSRPFNDRRWRDQYSGFLF